jgi:hypothetical protein
MVFDMFDPESQKTAEQVVATSGRLQRIENPEQYRSEEFT